MKTTRGLTSITLLLAVSDLSAATLYVSLESTNPTPPYTNWATAAANVQQAVGAAAAGDVIVVTNGLYAGGVSVTNPLTLLSVNGPQFTVFDGGRTNRCLSLADGASLTGFTLTNGLAAEAGGVWCASKNAFLTNCVMTGNSTTNLFAAGGGAYGGTLYDCTLTGNLAGRYGGGANGCTLHNCTLTGNSATFGAGASGSTLYNCTLSVNSASYGGAGAYGCTLSNCTLINNSAAYEGGGADLGTLQNCTLSGNSAAWEGGGVYRGTLYNCTLTGNSAAWGGGAYGCTLYNCTLSGNPAHSVWPGYPAPFMSGSGGGAHGCTLYNCTLTGNSAPYGGGATYSTLYNCIVYFNTSSLGGANYDASTTLYFCCATPLPAGGTGNIALDPRLASASHLGAGSPCRGAGSPTYATGTDIDGEPWGNPPSIGCDEYHPGAVTGPLTVVLGANFTNTTVGYPLNLTALIEGRTTGSVWDFGDGVVVSNRPCASHAWAVPGDYPVVLRAYNESLPSGVTTTVAIHVVEQPVRYVAAASTNPQPPYVSWATAATNIQDAVDATTVAGALVLVTNGVYAGGLVVITPLALLSVNGPQFTVINGGGTNRCAELTTGASLTGFTLTNGFASGDGNFGGGVCCASLNAFITNCVIVSNSVSDSGGGAYCCTLYDCKLTGNSAPHAFAGGALDCAFYNCTLTGNSASEGGGGAQDCTLYNCTLTGNSADEGGGADGCTLYNCTLSGNSAGEGGGAQNCTLYNCTLTGNSASGPIGAGVFACALYNCVVYANTAATAANYDDLSTLSYCCTTPDPGGVGNITLPPLFVDYTNGNLRLQSNSPCINAGNNTYVTTTTDLDGNPRIVSGTVDIGAYEYQGVGSVISYAWLQQYGLPTNGSADYADPDHDGLNNWQEWICGTNPTNALSALRLFSAQPAGSSVTASWQSVADVNYFLERSANLRSPFTLLASNIVGQASTTSYADTNGTGPGPFFYRVGVRSP